MQLEPAYVRRGLRVADAQRHVVETCAAQRRKWLEEFRWRLRELRSYDGNILRNCLAAPADYESLAQLWTFPDARPPATGEAAPPRRVLRRLLRELAESLTRFNRRWLRYVNSLDLAYVNREIDGYNRYYVLEKECALQSARLAVHGFRPLRTITCDDLLAQFPLLTIPQLAAR